MRCSGPDASGPDVLSLRIVAKSGIRQKAGESRLPKHPRFLFSGQARRGGCLPHASIIAVGSANLLNAYIGDYRLVDFLGAGGMGEVYRAVHSKLGRVVAIKILSRTFTGPDFGRRFLNEAQIQARLHHPNIATLYDFCEYGGQPCIIMEYVDGQTLDALLQTRGPFSTPEATAIFRRVVEAIGYIHDHGVIHRDIKSNNIKLTTNGEVKLLDFGIAKSESSPGLTAAGDFVGTLQYLSPEQLKGGRADVRSDIWSLGVLLHELVTGRLPFEANALGELYEKISKASYLPPSTWNPSLPRSCEAIISRCLKKNPSDRYSSTQELLQDLSAMESGAIGSENVAAPAIPFDGTKAQAWLRQNWMMAAGGLGIVIVFVVLFAVLSGGGGNSTLPPANSVSTTSTQGGESSAQAPTDHSWKIIRIDVSDGKAEVYKGGEMLGTTPYSIKARPGQEIDLILKRHGFSDKPVQLYASENDKVYTYTLEKNQ